MNRELPKCLRVMAEYGSSGIWVVEPHGPFRHGMVEHRRLGLPEELAAGFRQWIEDYWKVLDQTVTFDVAQFNNKGRRLAESLKRHVGQATRVLLALEGPDGALGTEEEIL